MNVVILRGTLSRPPTAKCLPSGDRMVTLEVTTRRPKGRAESVPVCWPDAPDRILRLQDGEEVVVTGRVRRRFFRAGGVTASRTEVVAESVWPSHHRARVARAIEAAVGEVTVVAATG